MSLRAPLPHGRHRACPPPLAMWQRTVAASWIVCLATAGSVAWPIDASADAPLQTAWWNMASGSSQAPPDPATPAGGIHVSALSSNVLAFGAVEYSLPAGASGQLVLQVANGAAPPAVDPNNPSATPSFTFQACPTIGAWRAGDDQPAASAPSYDTKHCFGGNESADGKTVSFFVDGGHQRKPGVLSLAIAPLPMNQLPAVGGDSPIDSTPPTSVDFDKPDVGSLTVTGGTSPPPPTAPSSTGAAPATGASGSSGGSGNAAGTGSAGGTAPGSLPTINTGPSVTTTAPDQGVSPLVAGNTAAAPNAAPAAATAPAASKGVNWALVLLLLLGFAVLASMIQRNNATAPIGERGLGRFRQVRERHARPLI
jgi:hypothetical protein